MRKRLLICAYGGGHIRAVLPVIQLAQASGRYEITVLGLTTAGRVLELEGIPHVGFRDLVRPELDVAALAKGKSLLGDVNSLLVDPEESIAYLGLSYYDLVSRLGGDEAERRYREFGRAAFLPLSILERAFERFQPDVLLSTNSPRAEEAAVRVARRLGIPSIVIVDLFGTGPDLPRIKDPSYAEVICVMNEEVRNRLIREGRSPDSLLVTGNPAFDPLLDSSLVHQGKSLRRKRNWEGKRVILYASGPDILKPDLPRAIERRLTELLSTHSEWHLVIRPHPNLPQDFSDLPTRVSRSGRDESLPILLHAVDVCVVAISTVGMEAAIAGVPLVSCDFASWTDLVPYSRMGLAHGASSLFDLGPVLEATLGDDRREARSPFYPAAPKVMALIDDLAEAIKPSADRTLDRDQSR